ncbi:MAG: hypothetical protein WKG07_40555 [Hymenobacter sp.]
MLIPSPRRAGDRSRARPPPVGATTGGGRRAPTRRPARRRPRDRHRETRARHPPLSARATPCRRTGCSATSPPACGCPQRQRTEVRPWSAAELAQFLQHSSGDRLGPVFEVIAACGLRRGEALGLRWSDVDLTSRVLHVRQTLSDVDGRLVFGTPKTTGERGERPA